MLPWGEKRHRHDPFPLNRSLTISISVNSWFGLRYAKSPIGDLRWRAPVPVEEGGEYQPGALINATSTGPTCVQGYPGWRFNATPGSSTPVGGSEDCLLLDILRPANPVSTKLPVLFQIHGGGYTQGFAESDPGYAIVNASNGNIMYVSIQYRLGPYGFLSSAAIKENGTANAGLLDQRLALEWVQKHIATFGGDPTQVTIIGGSAGGGSVSLQMILNGGATSPPFRSAIAGKMVLA
jgi:carboxylesterase type B